MGLHVSHDCFTGGYGKFMCFRRAVADVIGVPLPVMEGYFDADEWLVCAAGDLGRKTLKKRIEEVLPVSWKAWENDPLVVLLNHSDCEGEISWEDAGPLADRLDEIAPHLRKNVEREDWHWPSVARTFVAGLRKAHELRENVRFG